ncbi:hypothetical protein [Nigerium massiliense]|uniref:hypothetical protein n=1 Tax=Nigerium massiliense TaxID=1522317 RepID=UPI0005911750|nr:hypothetical protein [Nigerium massiliense]
MLNYLLIVCAGLSALGLIITVLCWPRARWRTVIAWLGLSLLPIALYLAGLAPLLIDAWNVLVEWSRQLPSMPVQMVGAALGGLGILLIVISRFLPRRPRRPRVEQTEQPQELTRRRPVYDDPAQQGRTRSYTGGSTSSANGRTASTSGGASAEDAEVADILKRRGIE